MIKIPDPVLIFYVITCLAGFFFRFVKDGVIKQLTIKPLIERLGIFALTFVPFIGLLFFAKQFGATLPTNPSVSVVEIGNTVPYFAGAAVLSYILGAVGIPSYLRGILLGASAVALTSLVQTDYISLSSALTGLLLVKLTENFAFNTESTIDDIVPPFTWLASIMWLGSIENTKDLPLKAALLLGIMAVSQLMRLLQGPFVFVGKTEDDRLFVKRVILACTAGLGILCVIVKMLNLLHFQSLALICGAGYFVTWLYKDLTGENRYALGGMQGLRLLILTGMLTLVATRLYGTFGLLALAPTAMVAPVSSAALLPGIFFASRALLQVYLQHFNMNVTGINLNHAYASAAQYAGFLLGVAMLIMLRENFNRKILLSLILSVSIITPVLSNFILHAEPTCSLFAAVIVSTLILSVIGPSLQDKPAPGSENISLAPVLMISSGILTSGLLELGNEATKVLKGTVLSYGVIFVLVLSFIFWFFFQRKNGGKPNSTVSVDPV